MHLERHAWRLGSRLDVLTSCLRDYEESAELKGADLFHVERIIIQMQIEWEHFVRAVILDSATGKYRTQSGPVRSNLPEKVQSREHAGFVLIKQYHKRKHEPDWYIPYDAINAAGRLKLTNAPRIANELGVTPWELDDLRHLRNFIAHRSGRSATTVRDVGCVSKSDRIVPSQVCFDFQAGGLRRYEGWAAFMKNVGMRLVK
ncbi:hypothetical protein [Agrobacterium tumefaciens]|uniref:hypothetical protein n=1 Tax=Agrobacterium tumefaciens TaxID=358 RepID=UPI001572CB23|nr:hypothetical protein [Agrobacterium tumefaciens]